MSEMILTVAMVLLLGMVLLTVYDITELEKEVDALKIVYGQETGYQVSDDLPSYSWEQLARACGDNLGVCEMKLYQSEEKLRRCQR